MKQGFFSSNETSFKKERMASAPSCGNCALKPYRKFDNAETKGRNKKGIIIVIDAMCITNTNHLTVLKYKFKEQGINLLVDCLLIPVTRCDCPMEESAKGASNCRPHVYSILDKQTNIKAIFCIGINPLISILGHKWKKGFDVIDRWRGYNIPLREYGVFVTPMVPLLWLLSDYKAKEICTVIFKQDLRQGLLHMKCPFYNGYDFKEEEECITLLTELQGIALLERMPTITKLIAFDYETNALKPYMKKHKIYCVGIATDINTAYAFTLLDQETKDALAKVLKNRKIRKIAANMKFEELWTRVKLKVKVLGWAIDTVLAAHIENQAELVTGVKFQSAVKLGVFDYSDSITPFLKSEEKGGNGLNKIHRVNKKDLLLYCGYDALVEMRLAFLIKDQMGVDL